MADGQRRECLTCRETKPLMDFTLQYHDRKDGSRHVYPGARCKPCVNKARRATYDPVATRGYSLKKRYGMTNQQFDERLAKQGGGCAACGVTEMVGKWWHVDHDHACCPTNARSCGRCIRGILCHPCNTALGSAGDSIERLEQLINYLKGAARGELV